jgi:thiol-disulfide isomerase/thioredoxin
MRLLLFFVAFVFLLACALPAGRAQDPVKVGSSVGKLRFTDIHYLPRTLDDFGPKNAFVLVFTNTSCPLARRYLPILQALHREYQDKGVQFIALNAADEDSIVAMATQAVQQEIEFPFVKDFGGVCARALGVQRTPEAVILDGQRRLRYRGRIDDQYRLGGERPDATRHDLKEALAAVLAGRNVAVAETEVDGCRITFLSPAAGQKSRALTFSRDVAPILRKHCWQCHQAGGSAPFSLTSYQQASKRAAAVAEVVSDGRMPPWFAAHEFGPFVNRRGLSDEERTIVLEWTRSGAALGDGSKVPLPPAEPKSKWLIGEPDLVLKTATHDLPAAGIIPYTYAFLPHIFTEDTWVQGVQIVPDNPRVLHHCNLAFGNLSGMREENFVTGYVPGGAPMALDDGVAFRIPKGSILGLQIHYVTTGKPEKCRVAVGLRFPRAVVQKRLQHIQLASHGFAIPPGAPAYKLSASRVLDHDVVGVGLFSHMHLRGKDMTFTAHLPNGRTDPLLVIANYSFSWQLAYRWQPGQKRLPKGTRLECVAHYDNSVFNPYNPDPKATVREGPQTYHEMMYGLFFYTNASEQLGLPIDPKTGREQKRNNER